MEEVRMKRHRFQSSIDKLVKDAYELAITAHKMQSLKTLESSNDLRKATKLKKVEIMSATLWRNLWFSIEVLSN